MNIEDDVKKNYNIEEFIQGMRDCKNGVSHNSEKSESYNAGYSTRYQQEQNVDNMTGWLCRGYSETF